MFKEIFALFGAVLLALVTSTALTLPAFGADTTTLASTVVDFQPVMALVIAIIGAIIIAIVRPGVKALVAYLETKSGIEIDASTRAYLLTAVDSAVGWAMHKVDEDIKDKSVTLDVKSELVAHSMAYLLNRVPDALAHFDLKPADLVQLIEARLSDSLGLTPVAASDATKAT